MAILLVGFIVSKMMSPVKDSSIVKQPGMGDKTMAQKDDQIKRLTAEKNRALEKIRAYQTQDDTSASAPPPDPPTQSISQKQSEPPIPVPAPEKRKSIAFKEMDEASLTDPEGLAPLEEDSGKRGVN